MNRNTYRWVIRAGIVVCVAAMALLWTLHNRQEQLVVINKSGQTIATLEVTVAGNTNKYQNVAAGNDVTIPFPAGSGPKFEVRGRLSNGTRVSARGVLSTTARVTVLPGGEIKIDQQEKR